MKTELELPDPPENWVALGWGGSFKRNEVFEGKTASANGERLSLSTIMAGISPELFYYCPEDSEIARLNGLSPRRDALGNVLPDDCPDLPEGEWVYVKGGEVFEVPALPLFSSGGVRWTIRDEKVGGEVGTFYKHYIYRHEPKVYWSKPEHFPPVCWVRKKESHKNCALVINVLDHFFETKHFNHTYEDLKDLVWSDKPFSRWEEGKECTL